MKKRDTIKTDTEPLSEELLRSLRDGEHSAMEYLYHTYWEVVFDTAYKRVRDEEIAQDITQEIFISVWEKRERLHIKSSLEAWLKGAVKYKVINYFKSSIVREKYEEDLVQLIGNQAEPSSAESMIILKELNQQLDHAMLELPEKMRVIFFMSRRQQKSTKEISDELNLSAQTVKNQLSAALKLIRKKLSYTVILIILMLLT